MLKTKLLPKIKMEDWKIFRLVDPLPSIPKILNSIPTKFIMVNNNLRILLALMRYKKEDVE